MSSQELVLEYRFSELLDSNDQKADTENKRFSIQCNISYLLADENDLLWGVYHPYHAEFKIQDVLQYCRSHQKNLPKNLIGDYVFIYFNKQTHELTVLRDRTGAMPVYYYWDPSGIIISTDIEEILKSPSVSQEPDIYWMHDYLLASLYDTTYTFYKNIKKLPAGHLLQVTNERCFTRAYQPYAIPSETLRYSREQDYIDHFSHLMEQSVLDRLPQAGKVGLELSGGLDSNAIAGILGNVSGGENSAIHAYSHAKSANSVFDEPHERAWIAESVRLLSIENHRYIDRSNKGVRCLYDAAFALRRGIPAVYYATFSQDILRYAREDGVSVLFSGWGGDDCISQHGRLMQHYFSKNRWRKAWKLMEDRSILQKLRIIAGQIKGKLAKKPYNWKAEIPAHLNTIRHFSSYYPGLKTIDTIARLKECYEGSPIDPKEKMLWRLQQFGLIARLEAAYHLGRKDGLRYVYPWLDPRLIEFMLSLPYDILLHPKESRYLFRKTIGKWLPPAIANRRKERMDMYGWVMDAYLYDYIHDIPYKTAPASPEELFYQRVEAYRDELAYKGAYFAKGLNIWNVNKANP